MPVFDVEPMGIRAGRQGWVAVLELVLNCHNRDV